MPTVPSGSLITPGGAQGPAGATSVLACWPVGSIFMAAVPTNPATLLGGGTWVQFGQGRIPIGQNSGDTDFDTVEETGGSKTLALAVGNLPSHTHAGAAHTHGMDHYHPLSPQGATDTAPDHQHGPLSPSTQFWGRVTSGGSGGMPAGSTEQQRGLTALAGAHSHALTGTTNWASAANAAYANTGQANEALTTGATGSGTAVNHMNPYIVVYMWKRVS